MGLVSGELARLADHTALPEHSCSTYASIGRRTTFGQRFSHEFFYPVCGTDEYVACGMLQKGRTPALELGVQETR